MLIIYIIIFVTSHQKGREWKIKRVGGRNDSWVTMRCPAVPLASVMADGPHSAPL